MDDVSMKYEIGEKVQVKSYEEIQKTLDESCHLRGYHIYFNIEMKKYCGKIYEIESYVSTGPYYHLRHCEMEPGNCWNWPEEWLEPVEQTTETNKFKAGDIAVVRPDLKEGILYGKLTFKSNMKLYKGTVVHIEEITSEGNYIIKESGFIFSEEMLLTIEEAFRHGTVVAKVDGNTFSNGQHTIHVDWIKDNSHFIQVWFEETKIWLCPHELKIISIPSFNPIKNKKDYENQLQRKKTSIRGAEVPEGHRVRSRKSKASVVIGHLSNQARVGY